MQAISSTALFDQVVASFDRIAPKVPIAVLGVLFGIVLIRIIAWIVQLSLSLVRLPKGLRGIIISLVDALLWVFLTITFLQNLGLSNLALIFSGGVAALGLALGAGASSLAADILAGIFLAQDRDFDIGDQVSAGEKPTVGIVESMDMRRTRIRDKDGHLHVIPNSVIERKEWIIMAQPKPQKPAKK